MQPEPQPPTPAAAKRRGKRIIAAAFVTLASVFIGLSSLQIIPQALGIGIRPVARASAGQDCADGVRSLSAALDRGVAHAAAARMADDDAAVAAFGASLSPEWDAEGAVAQRCAADPHGQDAFAALLRLRMAQEHFIRKNVVEIAPLRRDVAAYLPN